MRLLSSSLMLGEFDPMVYRGSAVTVATAGISKPANIAIGDLLAVVGADDFSIVSVQTSSGGVWTKSLINWATPGYHSALYLKIADATDINPSNGWGFIGGARSATALAWDTHGNAAGFNIRSAVGNPSAGLSSLNLSSFSPGNTYGVIAFAIDRDNDLSPVVPAGFVSRHNALLDSSWKLAAADHDGYAGTNVTWTGMDAGAADFAEVGWLVEVTGS